MPSVEPESITTISSQNDSEATQSPIRSASLKAMMQADSGARPTAATGVTAAVEAAAGVAMAWRSAVMRRSTARKVGKA